MFTKRKMLATSLLLTLAALLTLSGPEAFAKTYTRSCGARYIVCPTSFSGSCWQFDFSGKGKIGYYNPNKARERARHNIEQCLNSHWARYTATGKPRECTSANLIYNYPVNSLIVDMTRNICSRNPGHDTVQVSVSAIFNGKKGCTLDHNNWQTTIARNHTIFCRPDQPLY